MTTPAATVPAVDPEEEIPRLLDHLGTQADGLDEREAARRLQQVGANAIRRESGPRAWRSLLGQFTHPLALLLWMAAGLSLVTGVITLAIAIVVVIVLNAAFAFAQERQAGTPPRRSRGPGDRTPGARGVEVVLPAPCRCSYGWRGDRALTRLRRQRR